MAHSIEEARVMTRVAKETGLVTQMGNNGHGGEGLRLTREWIQAGAIGPVREIHCWSDRPGNWWKQDRDRPTDTPPVPAELDWNLWLGAAPERPYHPVYCPVAWRGWFDFGTGALGDMAIHNMDPAFYALDLDAPMAAEAADQPAEEGIVPGLADHHLRVRRQGRPARGEADLVRRRQACRRARPGSSRTASWTTTASTSSATRARSSAAAGPGRRGCSRRAR